MYLQCGSTCGINYEATEHVKGYKEQQQQHEVRSSWIITKPNNLCNRVSNQV